MSALLGAAGLRPAAESSLLVSTDWLAKNLKDRSVMVLVVDRNDSAARGTSPARAASNGRLPSRTRTISRPGASRNSRRSGLNGSRPATRWSRTATSDTARAGATSSRACSAIRPSSTTDRTRSGRGSSTRPSPHRRRSGSPDRRLELARDHRAHGIGRATARHVSGNRAIRKGERSNRRRSPVISSAINSPMAIENLNP